MTVSMQNSTNSALQNLIDRNLLLGQNAQLGTLSSMYPDMPNALRYLFTGEAQPWKFDDGYGAQDKAMLSFLSDARTDPTKLQKDQPKAYQMLMMQQQLQRQGVPPAQIMQMMFGNKYGNTSAPAGQPVPKPQPGANPMYPQQPFGQYGQQMPWGAPQQQSPWGMPAQSPWGMQPPNMYRPPGMPSPYGNMGGFGFGQQPMPGMMYAGGSPGFYNNRPPMPQQPPQQPQQPQQGGAGGYANWANNTPQGTSAPRPMAPPPSMPWGGGFNPWAGGFGGFGNIGRPPMLGGSMLNQWQLGNMSQGMPNQGWNTASQQGWQQQGMPARLQQRFDKLVPQGMQNQLARFGFGF